MTTTNSTFIQTDFSLAPYYDDYDESKGFYRIPFRPGYPVQARELTQLQTILQKQIFRLGSHIFQDGSIVIPGQFTYHNSEYYVKINDTDNSGNAIVVNDWIGKTITGATTGLRAYVVAAEDGTETETNTKTLYIRYLNTSNDGTTTEFNNSEVLLDLDGNNVVALSSSSTGKGYRFEISDGVVFAKEFFVSFPKQSIVLSRYDTTPNCVVGFILTESIVRYTSDQSLLDPALGVSNYAAPGADRFKITATLEKYDIDNQPDINFVKLFIISNGVIIDQYNRSEYSILRDEMAKRTYDESGDYIVKGFEIRLRENFDDGSNYGYSNTGNSQLLSIGIEAGTAYVKGFEINKMVTSWITTEKGLTYSNVNSQIMTPLIGNYMIVDEFVGAWNMDEGTEVLLYDTAQDRISAQGWSSAAQTGLNIGTAKIKGLEYSSGVPGTSSAQYKLYLFDIQMIGSNAFSNVKSIYYNNASVADMGADIVLTNNVASLYETTNSPLVYYIGSDAVKTIRDSSGNPDTTFTFKRSEDITISANGTFTVSILTSSEQSPYGTGTLGDTDKQEFILTINENKSISLTGNVSGTNGSTTLTGSGTTFTNLNAGDKLSFNGYAPVHTISSIVNATSIVLTSALTSNLSSNTFTKVYKIGDIIDLTTNGATGSERTVVSTSSSLTFDLKESFGATVSGSLVYRVSRTSAKEIAKTLKNSRFVKINCNSAGVSGPFNLGFSDIYQIRSIRKDTSVFTTSSQGTDVTTAFVVDNGQKDSFYDHGNITPKATAGLTSSTHLLVELDYFEPDFTQGVGYFSVDSYPVNDSSTSNTTIHTEDIPIFTSPISGNKYDLRNYLDFRPVKDISAADSTTVAGASTNPSNSTTFNFEANGLRLPVPSSQVVFDYSHYLPRRDIVVINSSGNISVIRGIPAASPKTPTTPDDMMLLGKIYIPPYPSLAPNYANVINRRDLAAKFTKTNNQRSTMRDINVIKDRLTNVEYYAALNALEKSALDMKYLDENGLNRFKNGIFVDNFRNHSLGETTSPDYKIVVDPDENTIRPLYTMESIYYRPISNTNIVINSGIATLAFTEEAFITNNNATTTINNDAMAYRFIGELFSIPDNDVWVDTEYLQDNPEVIGFWDEFEGQPIATTWNQWQRNIVGYNNQEAINTNSTRTSSETYTTTITSSSTNDKVIDVSLISYIRPQIILVNSRNLKANSRYYTYFDGENMSNYMTAFLPSSNTKNTIYSTISSGDGAASPFDSELLNFGTIVGSEGDALYSDQNGEIFALLRLPEEKRFRVGTKEIKLTDNPSNSSDAVSYATGQFFALGIVQQKQGDTYSTRTIINTITEMRSGGNTGIYSFDINGLADSSGSPGSACSAYSFLVKAPTNEEGLFISSFDIFVAEKHASLGLWCEIREMNNDGVVSANRVPLSDVYVANSDIVTSDDATVPLHINFRAPIFLYNNKEYALVIHSYQVNPDLYLWVSKLGENDINTGNKVSSRTYTGTFYSTNNNMDWYPIAQTDLKMVLYRAVFDTSSTGTIIIGNKPVEKFKLSNTTAVMSHYGENVIGDDTITLSGIAGGTIVVGDVLVGNISNSNSSVVSINSSDYKMANTGYRVGEKVTAYFSSNLVSRGITANVSAITRGSGVLYKYVDSTNNVKVHLIGSNGKFEISDTIHGQFSNDRATIDEIQNFRYSVVDFEPAYLNFIKTSIDFSMQATSNTGTKGNYFSIKDNENIYFNDEQAVYSRKNEIDDFSGTTTNNVKAVLSTSSSYLSPIVDIGRSHSIYVDNIINANTTGEDSTSGGKLINKYISQTVTLEDGQDAEDIKVVLTAYRPPNTDVKVWVKFLNAEDGETMAQKSWIELEKLDDTVYSSLANMNDFIVFNYKIPVAYMTGTNGEFQYTDSSGSVYTGYKYYAVKIGLSGSNSAVVPKVGDLQVINLQM